MKTKNLIRYLMVVATVGIFVFSCKKETSTTPGSSSDSDVSVASDQSLAEGNFNDVNNMADESITGSVSAIAQPSSSTSIEERGTLSTCATVTIDTTSSSTHSITINFGTSNCMCSDGRNRRGIINISFTGSYRSPGSVHTITFSNYFVDDNQILGTKTVTNNGYNGSGHLTYSVSVDGSIIKANNGGTITWTSNRTREWIAGSTTATRTDDIYLITGSGSGTTAGGTSFTVSITTALRRALSCQWFESGIVDITPSGKATRTVNFGDGTCDNAATVTIKGTTYNITLR